VHRTKIVLSHMKSSYMIKFAVLASVLFQHVYVGLSLDYYQTLNVNRHATNDEIRASYKQLAKKYHPDKNPGDPNAQAKFIEIQTAYETVSDPSKRSQYDLDLDGGWQSKRQGGQRREYEPWAEHAAARGYRHSSQFQTYTRTHRGWRSEPSGGFTYSFRQGQGPTYTYTYRSSSFSEPQESGWSAVWAFFMAFMVPFACSMVCCGLPLYCVTLRVLDFCFPAKETNIPTRASQCSETSRHTNSSSRRLEAFSLGSIQKRGWRSVVLVCSPVHRELLEPMLLSISDKFKADRLGFFISLFEDNLNIDRYLSQNLQVHQPNVAVVVLSWNARKGAVFQWPQSPPSVGALEDFLERLVGGQVPTKEIIANFPGNN